MNTQPKGLRRAAVARFMAVALFFDALAPLFPQMAKSQNLSDALFQTILGVCFIVFALSQLLSVPIIGIVGLYRSSALSCIYLGVAATALCASQSPYIFAAVFASMFAVNSIGSNATRVALREATSDEGFRRLFAWAGGVVEIKQIAMPFVAGAIATAFGWRWALMVLVAPVMIAGIWIELAYERRQAKSNYAPSNGTKLSGWKAVATTPAFLTPTLIAAAFQIAFSPLSARLPFILADGVNLFPAMIGLVLSVASCIIAASLFLSGYLAPRWSSMHLIRIGAGMMAAGLLAMALSYFLGVYAMISGIILVQGAFGFIIVPCSGDALSASESQRTIASALFGFVQPIVGGFSVAITGLLGLPHIGSAIALTIISLSLIAMTMIVTSNAAGRNNALYQVSGWVKPRANRQVKRTERLGEPSIVPKSLATFWIKLCALVKKRTVKNAAFGKIVC